MYQKHKHKRAPTDLTSKPLQDVISSVLLQINSQLKERPDLILQAWPKLVGPQIAPHTQAFKFEKGVMYVKVSSSTLYSLLAGSEKERLTSNLKKMFSQNLIKGIKFSMG